MAHSTTTKEDIASRAFVLIGANPVTDFSAGDSESDLANLLYEEMVQAELGSYEWNFAKKTVLLSRNLTAPVDTDRWTASYRIDADAIIVRGVFVNGWAIDYEIQEDNILCDASEDDSVYMTYMGRPDEGVWPPPFQTAMIYKLAADFAGSLARDADLIEAFQQMYGAQIRRAKTMDSQAETNKSFRTRSLINVRR